VSSRLKLVFACPVCEGPIAFWVLQPAFTCHHCNWVLSSNVRSARVWAVGVAVAVELALLVALLAWLPPRGTGLVALLSLGGVLGFAVGWVALGLFVALHPVHPPESAGFNPLFERSALRALASAAQRQR
jgi:hypothetical protein